MEAKFSAVHAGKPAAGGLQNRSQITGAASVDTAFGLGVVRHKTNSAIVGTATGLGVNAGTSFAGFTVYSQEATGWKSTGTGPTVRNAVYPDHYKAGDVVGVLTRGNIIVPIDASSKGVKAGDRIVVTVDGTIKSFSEVVPATPGTSKVYGPDAIALSDGAAGEFIGIDVFGIAAATITI